MSKFETRKDKSRFETVALRAKRAAKYANAATFTRAGRPAQIIKGAF